MIDGRSLADSVLRRELGAIARAISLVEDTAAEASQLLKLLHPHTGRAFVMGITGPSGAGKSTLVDGVAGQLRAGGSTVGIIAVDPTSPFSGGALLGDRIRMQSLASDPDIFIRSMATRGSLGGLSHSVPEAVQVLDAAGYTYILVETVGVGQAEIDIALTADVCVLVLMPGLGDDVQALKAGIMEIGDIFVLNKSDREGAAALRRQVEFFLSLSNRRDRWVPPIVETVATEGRCIRELTQEILRFRDFYQQSELRRLKKVHVARQRLVGLLREKVLARVLEKQDDARSLDDWADQIVDRKVDLHSAAESILARCRLDTGHQG